MRLCLEEEGGAKDACHLLLSSCFLEFLHYSFSLLFLNKKIHVS